MVRAHLYIYEPLSMQAHRPIVVRTLGDFLTYNHGLRAICPRCEHSERLDIRRLIERFGGDLDPNELRPLFRCMNCDHRGAQLQVTVDVYKLRPGWALSQSEIGDSAPG